MADLQAGIVSFAKQSSGGCAHDEPQPEIAKTSALHQQLKEIVRALVAPVWAHSFGKGESQSSLGEGVLLGMSLLPTVLETSLKFQAQENPDFTCKVIDHLLFANTYHKERRWPGCAVLPLLKQLEGIAIQVLHMLSAHSLLHTHK